MTHPASSKMLLERSGSYYLIGWGSPFDADDHTYKVFGTGKGANYSGYSNALVDQSHNRQHLAGMEREGQVPDCLHLSLRRVEGDRQIFNFQQFKHSASL